MGDPQASKDPFVAMVTARAEVDLRLSDFHPRSMLAAPGHEIPKPKFPVIDYHNHLDAQEPREVLRVMDECGIERIVNITMHTGEQALEMIRKFHSVAAGPFRHLWLDGLERMCKLRDFSNAVWTDWNNSLIMAPAD